MAKINTLRQSGIIPNDRVEAASVAVVGVGAIGSHTVEALSKMGVPKFTVYDNDIVEEHNLANQGYFLDELGQPKVEALTKRITKGTGAEVIPKMELVTADTRFEEIFVISAVDSMRARKGIWEAFRKSNESRFFIDGRMGARFGQLFVVDKVRVEQIEAYEKTLFDDADGLVAPCTEKSTIFCAYGLSSLIAALMAEILIGRNISYALEVDFANFVLIKNTIVEIKAPE